MAEYQSQTALSKLPTVKPPQPKVRVPQGMVRASAYERQRFQALFKSGRKPA